MAKVNKWLYGWKLYVDYGYGQGFEYETFELTFNEGRRVRLEYRENATFSRIKLVSGREVNPEWERLKIA